MKSKRYMKNSYGVLAALCGLVAIAAQFLFGGNSGLMAANVVIDSQVDVHCEQLVRTNDAAITVRHLLYKEGSTAGTGAAVCGAGDLPLGTIDNTEASTGVSQNVLLLGKSKTRKMVANAAMATLGVWVYTAANGKVQVQPTSAGTYYRVGRLLTASGADADVIEVETCLPRLITVIAALGNTNSEISGVTISSQTSAALTGTLTGTANGSLVDIAAAAGACGGGATPANTDVDAAIATAVATIVSGTNEQLKELQTQLNAAIVDVANLITHVTAMRTKLEELGDDTRAALSTGLAAGGELLVLA